MENGETGGGALRKSRGGEQGLLRGRVTSGERGASGGCKGEKGKKKGRMDTTTGDPFLPKKKEHSINRRRKPV